MPEGLNKVPRDRAEDILRSVETRIEKARVAVQTEPQRISGLAYTLRDYGLTAYRLDYSPHEVVEKLEEAGEIYSRQEVVDRERYQQVLLIDLCFSLGFSSSEVLRRSAELEIRPETLDRKKKYASAIVALQALLDLLRESVNVEELNEQLSKLEGQKSSLYDQRFAAPVVKTVLACHSKDAILWNEALHTIDTEHRRGVKKVFAWNTHGYMSLIGTGMLRLGLEKRMKPTIDSPYLPLILIEEVIRRS